MSAQPEGLSVDAKRLPEANEFSPGQVNLREVLLIAATDEGNRPALVEALRERYFAASAATRETEDERLTQQRTRANNVLIGMKGYGLFDLKSNSLTDVGRRLLAISDDDALHAEFAEHILRERHGLDVIEAIRSIQTRDEKVTKASLQIELEARGFSLPRATTHHTKLRQWLGEAGVVKPSYQIDFETLARILGVELESLDEWARLSPEQQAFLQTLRRMAESYGTDSIPAKAVVDQAKIEHGPIFREDQLSARIFRPLTESGWFTQDVGKGGRGGKSGHVAAASKLLDIDLDLVPTGETWGVPRDLRARRDTPLAQILVDLDVDDTYVKGVALELLALRMVADAALVPVRFRLRARATGGAEVDLIAEAVHLHHSRWLFQCKNTKSVTLSDAAKEIGVASLLRAHVVVLVTTGKFPSTVTDYVREIAEVLPLQVVLIDGAMITKYRDGGPPALMRMLRDQAQAMMRLKRAQIDRSATIVVE